MDFSTQPRFSTNLFRPGLRILAVWSCTAWKVASVSLSPGWIGTGLGEDSVYPPVNQQFAIENGHLVIAWWFYTVFCIPEGIPMNCWVHCDVSWLWIPVIAHRPWKMSWTWSPGLFSGSPAVHVEATLWYTKNDGTSPFLMGKSTINGNFQ